MISPKPLKCSEVGRRDVLKDLILHKLPRSRENLILEHLKSCPECLSLMAIVLSESIGIPAPVSGVEKIATDVMSQKKN